MTYVWRQCLLMVLGVWALAVAAQAGEHVDWFDDGTVLLKLGPTYDDAVIETSRGELGSTYEFPPPNGTARLADYIEAGWDRTDVEDYLKAHHATYTAPTMLSYLRIRGTPEYWSVLDGELAAAVSRRKTAQQALDDVAAAWERITDRLGRQQQLELYRAAIGYPHGPNGSG